MFTIANPARVASTFVVVFSTRASVAVVPLIPPIVWTASTFVVVFSTRASTAVVHLISPIVWTASKFPLVNLTRVSMAAQSHVFTSCAT